MSPQNNMVAEFAPKGEETLRTEALEDLGLEAYEGNEEVVDRVVARLKSSEDFKASLHADKTKAREKLKETRKLAGLDPETGEKLPTNVVEPAKKEDFSTTDLYALMEAKVPKEELETVKKAAAILNLPVAEALNTPYVKTLLATNAEERKSAAAANAGVSPRRVVRSDDETILEEVAKGNLPQSPEDIAKFVQAQHNAKLKKLKT